MKKSEYEEKRRAAWSGGRKSEDLIRHDVEAAEAAGVAWDPEEPILADEISCGVGVGFLGRLTRPTYKSSWYKLGYEGGAPFDARATATEAGRRYNAWLEKLTELWAPGAFSNALRATLRGGSR